MSERAVDRLPRVDRVVAHPLLADARRRLGAALVADLVRRAVAEARERVREGAPCPSVDDVAASAATRAAASLESRTRRVINATGVVLHTNLGRAPLSSSAVAAVAESAAGYASLELDLQVGRRGPRGAFAEVALARLSRAEAALVVNNNAAAVLLALASTASGRAVLVSRGELVEIGGGFRIPDVVSRSGARIVEVGTTNRTRVADYAEALDAHQDAAAILRVHQGNFRQTGYVERPLLPALARLARDRGVLLVEDLGGGALADLSEDGLHGEPVVPASIAAGVDVVCFSTDKVLGGPQGGALVGRAAAIEAARRDPLARAVRLGRLPLVALEATLSSYLERDLAAIPALAALRAPVSALRDRAEGWRRELAARGVEAEVVALDGRVGGGAFAVEELPSAGIALHGDADDVARRLRDGDPPVVARVRQGRVVIDARTVLPGEDDALLRVVTAALAGGEARR